MKEYIKKQDALEIIKSYWHESYNTVQAYVLDVPAADVAEVSRGKWIPVQEYPNNPWYRECSECGRAIETIKRSKYCPNCGAKMEG